MAGPFRFFLLIGTLLWVFIAANRHEKTNIGVATATAMFRTDSQVFALAISDLEQALFQLDSARPATILRAREALVSARLAYKRIEYFLEYFFYTSSRVYNRAPKNEIEEPFLEYQELAGLQYIETLLLDSLPEQHSTVFAEQGRLLRTASSDLNSLLYQFEGTDGQMLESVRVELIRVISLGISGFDAPILKSGIRESAVAMETMQKVLKPYLERKKQGADSARFYMNSALQYLEKNPDFDSFDRLEFLTEYALPLQKYLGKMIRDSKLEVNKYGVLNYAADNIFSPDAFQKRAFPGNGGVSSEKQRVLGEKLFSETMLSGNGSKSCVSCHNAGNYFTDGLPRSIAFDINTMVKRNAPTLLYAGYQHGQFWDGRVKSLEEQVEAVIRDPLEMNGQVPAILEKLNGDRKYRRAFQKAFLKKRNIPIGEDEVYRSIAAYIRTLNPYNSPFDQYLRGDRQALTDHQKAGFNLFMGKAQCGTCHFVPLFNGLIPPFYSLTEFEILGTTNSDDFANPGYDADEGRFTFRPIKFYKGAFKTPTVRNAEKTGPYMHNGAFKSLETLIEFYDLGGGTGLGLDLPEQTLSSDRLNLTEDEKKNIVVFLNALTDNLKDI